MTVVDVKKYIDVAVQQLVKYYHPIAIYLFGSFAWGEPTEDSDLDIMMIVGDDTEIDFAFIRKVRRSLSGLDISKDILVNTKAKFYMRAEHPSSLQHKILKEGKILYEIT